MGKLILTKEDCEKWKKVPNKNPKTNYTLKDNSKLLQEISKTCTEILGLNKPVSPKPVSPKPVSPKPVSPKPVTPKPDKPLKPISPKNDKHDKHDKPVKPVSPKSFELYYPDLDDSDFATKIANIPQFSSHKVPEYPPIHSVEEFNKLSDKLCGTFEISYYQHFISQYISFRTPYKSILLYHGVGVGKTCSAITLAEAFLIPHNTFLEPKIWVIMPHALKTSFKNQIFDIDGHTFENLANQCTGDTYIKLLNITKDLSKLKAGVKKLIKSRYMLFTYDAFAKFIQGENAGKIVKDKIIIVDEAHNIRSTEKENKDVFIALKQVLTTGVNNRLVLLSATPMYNEPRDILDLFELMLLNDKRDDIIQKHKYLFDNLSLKIDENVLNFIKQLSSTYVSYLKGKNPFTFALKLSPKYSGIQTIEQSPTLDPFGKPIPAHDTHWISKIEDGIVPSKLGQHQKDMLDSLEELEENNIFNNLQPMNIVYDDDIGEKGFYTFFSRTKDTDPICAKYNKQYMNALLPDEEHLGKYSGKFLNICNFVKKSKGIVVIYSRYRWSGILPLAICLEHLGFLREGTNNILDKADVLPDALKYDGIRNPKYCILSSENRDIMGSTTIDGLIQKINNPANIDGSMIKVILITPVASEGLSFYNAREIHLIEPWYHFNRAVQIIGRGIRNCRHQQLPFAEKNVTVFMHASVSDDENKESIDLHAFRISTRKYTESNEIDKIINNNSLDCFLMKNINYFPKSLFKLGKVPINTSQGVTINYQFGDDEKLEPLCSAKSFKLSNVLDDTSYRRDTYKHLITNTKTMLRKLVIEEIRNEQFFIALEKILQDIKIEKHILYETIKSSIYPNTLIDGYSILPHKDGLHILSIKPIHPKKITIVFDKEAKTTNPKQSKDRNDRVIKQEEYHVPANIKIDRGNINNSTISLYSSLDSKTFHQMMRYFMQSTVLNETEEYIADCLYIQGVLIHRIEMPNFINNNNKYIGYVNIFNIKNTFDAILYNANDGKYRDINDREKEALFARRQKYNDVPADMSQESMAWGVFTPKKLKDKEDIVNIFKLFTKGESAGKKTGIDCTSLKKNEQLDIFQELAIPDIDGTKLQNCSAIANELLSKGRLTLLPFYKPRL